MKSIEQFRAIYPGIAHEAIEHIYREAHQEGFKAGYEQLNRPYHELINAVARKFMGETRHQTALRYIQEAEHAPENDAAAKQNTQQA